MPAKKNQRREYERYFRYLDELRDSGKTNMLAAAPYLTARFGLTRAKAKKVLLAWIESFDRRGERR